MKKLIISLTLLAFLLTAMCGCGVSTPDDSSADTTVGNADDTVPPEDDTADSADPFELLDMSVYEIQRKWGEMHLESSEDGYRYSAKKLDGIIFSYSLPIRSSYEEKLPSLIVMTEGFGGDIYGVSLNSAPTLDWDSVGKTDGTAVYQKDLGDYIITATADISAGEKTEEQLLSEPIGKITELRLARDISVYSSPRLEDLPQVTVEDISGSDRLKNFSSHGNIYFGDTDTGICGGELYLFGRVGGRDNTFCVADTGLETGYIYTLSPPDGYGNPAIVCVQESVSGGAAITVRAEKDGEADFFDYIFSFEKDSLSGEAAHYEVYPLDSEHKRVLASFLEEFSYYYDPYFISSVTVDFDTEYMFDREYMDFTYDPTYLEGIASDGELEAWTAKYNSSATAFDRKYRPMLYKAIIDLRIKKEDFLRVNEQRKLEESEKALDDRYIDALFLPEDDLSTVRRVLKHPLAYYDYLDNLYCARDAIKNARFGDSAFARERYLSELDRFSKENGVTPPMKNLSERSGYWPEIVTDEYGIIKKAIIDIGDFDRAAEFLSGSIGHPYTIEVNGLCTDVSLYMSSGSHADSITAYGHTVPVNITVYGNCGAYLFDNGGAVVFTGVYYDIGNTYIITENGGEQIPGEENYSLILRRDNDGNIIWKRTILGVAGLWQCGDLSHITDYDTLIYEYGPAEIVDGKVVYGEATERFLASDLELQRIFDEQYKNKYNSLEELFESNRQRLEGETEK